MTNGMSALPVVIYTAYDPPPKVRIDCSGDPVLTRQSEKESADINVIMRRYIKTGLLPPGFNAESVFADVSEVGTYRDVVERVEHANREFMKLPSAIRKRFGHSPGEFLEFVSDPANRPELEQLGLVRKVEPAPAGGTAAPAAGGAAPAA